MKIEKAIERLSYTIENTNTPNDNDVDALNVVIDYTNTENERLYHNYHLFGKLFIGMFRRYSVENNGDYQQSLNDLLILLKIPLDEHYDMFHKEINQIEFEIFIDFIGISDKHSATKTGEENIADIKLIAENGENLAKVLTHYSKDKVYDRLNTLLLKLIKEYDQKY